MCRTDLLEEGKKSPSCRRVELSRLLMTCLPPHCLPPLSRQQFNNCSNFACSKGRAALKQALFKPLASNSCLQGMGPSRLRNPRLLACILPLQSCVFRKLKTFLLLPSWHPNSVQWLSYFSRLGRVVLLFLLFWGNSRKTSLRSQWEAKTVLLRWAKTSWLIQYIVHRMGGGSQNYSMIP